MTKAELESKPLAELHTLAAEANVPRYRMLSREELVEKLAAGEAETKPKPRQRREPSRQRQGRGREGEGGERRPQRQRREPGPKKAEAPVPPKREESTPASEERRPRRRRRRRFGRKRKELRLPDVLLPVAPGGYAIAYAETREACTTMLRELASELSRSSKAPDPVVLLVDPGPEELAEWRRMAPQAEIVAAAQSRHAEDALAQAVRRAEGGEAVVILIDSLTRFGETFKDAEAAKELLDSGRAGATLTVVAALERR